MTTARFAAWGVLAALVVLASPVARAAGEVTLARKLKKGETARYRYEVAGTVATAEFTVSGRIKEQVADVTPDGNFTLITSAEEVKLTVMGAEMAIPEEGPVTTKHDRFGRLTELSQEQMPQQLLSPQVHRLAASIEGVLLPDKPVAPSATWETELPNPAAEGKKVLVKTTFLGTEKVGDADLWKLRQTAEADTGQATPLKTDVTYWLNPADGQIVRLESRVTDLPSQFGPMSWTEKRERVKP